jgi:hypothetical protein
MLSTEEGKELGCFIVTEYLMIEIWLIGGMSAHHNIRVGAHFDPSH